MNGNGGAGATDGRRLVDGGRFELIERLGSGGMGTVWRARDTVLHREVALKEVRPPDPTAESGATLRERVLREARALARISHPHVVTIHQIVDTAEDPHPWLVMELLPGNTLQDRLEQSPLTPVEAARLGRQVLAALRAAHAAGIQHRDVKPANVMLRADGSAVLTDFGIAALQGSTSLTATGDLVGSPEFIAPERIRGVDNDPASDLWSLGLVLYVAAEGHNPLRRGTPLATLAAVLDESVPPPVRSGPLAPALQTLLVRDPAARPDAARLDQLLAEAESGRAPSWPSAPGAAQAAYGYPPQAPAYGYPPQASYGYPPQGHGTPHPSTPYPPAHPTSTAPGTTPRRSRTPVIIAVAAVVVAVVAASALALNLRDSGGTQAGDTTGGGGQDDGRDRHTTAPKEPADSASPGRQTDRPADPAPESSSSRPAPSATPTSPRPPATGTWVAQFLSEPVSSGTATRDMRLARVRKDVPEAKFVRSDNYASLRPGYWVIYAPGPFADGRAALRYCAQRGRTSSDTCVGRFMSNDVDDIRLLCRPPVQKPTGTCTRR
ncbi:Serine/threonine-protein kinase StkP [Streptomyces sp. YIM 130001]|uniref:serine/threonine-protein kinase n=1 Tax=Streptomyces sp. YIM 130001 TaxID=2259644 RepID=UPI000ECE3BD6|nr:serine/threonine-protein kinase [Streptomyces sp. YIM 130001]RII18310.1 Serine/threonine-protein kinase StkP [Streptomyces sp. YIM 130001]